jgi:hypothetical protein
VKTVVTEDRVIFIPTNSEIPIEFLVKGRVFIENDSSKVMVSFKQDKYLYKT